MIGIIIVAGIIAGIYFVTYCLMSTASKTDRELEILHQLEFLEREEEPIGSSIKEIQELN